MILDYLGRSPISVPVFITGKLAFLLCSFFFLAKYLHIASMLFDSMFTQIAGVTLFVAGLCMLIAAIVQLGQSTAVGIPERQTALKTHGIYRLSRNPIYVGAFIMCAGSCLFSIHLVNILLFVIAVVIHVHIIRKEEEFLEKRFGQQWLDYKRLVPRYIGRIRRAAPHRGSV